jgi:hypothetical protein
VIDEVVHMAEGTNRAVREPNHPDVVVLHQAWAPDAYLSTEEGVTDEEIDELDEDTEMEDSESWGIGMEIDG